MTRLPDPSKDDRLQRLGREWFAQVRREDGADRSAERKRPRADRSGDGDGSWLDGWFSSDCASDADGGDGGCGD